MLCIYHNFLSTHLLMNIWTVCTFWPLWIVLLWPHVHLYLFEYLFLFLLGIYLVKETLYVFTPKFKNEFKFCWQLLIKSSVKRNVTCDRFLSLSFLMENPFVKQLTPTVIKLKSRDALGEAGEEVRSPVRSAFIQHHPPHPLPKTRGSSPNLLGSGQQLSEPLLQKP